MKKLLTIAALLGCFSAPAATWHEASFLNGNYLWMGTNTGTTVSYGDTNVQYVSKQGKRVKSWTGDFYAGSYSLAEGSNGVQVTGRQPWAGDWITNVWRNSTNVSGTVSNMNAGWATDVPALALSSGAVSSNATITIVLSTADNTNSLEFNFARVTAGGWVDPVAVQSVKVTLRAASSNAVTTAAIDPGLMQGARAIRLLGFGTNSAVATCSPWTNGLIKAVSLGYWAP